MDFFTVEINPCDIHIGKKLIAELMGVDPENIPEPYNGIIQRELDQIINYRNIRGGFCISENFEISKKDNVFRFENTEFIAGKQLISKLVNSERLAFFICTAGEEITLRSREQMRTGDMLEGYVSDITGSLLVEGAMDLLHDILRKKCIEEGLKITNRYSPGYCNWKVTEQRKLFRLFPENFCGVRLSESAMMIPLKSVSGVIGIGRDVEYDQHLCNECSEIICTFRNTKNRYT